MALASGTTLGPYQIQAPLGAGGMGEVYQASDTQLDRTVAIKVLPEHVANDPDLKQRFEGKSQASLIGAIMTSDPPPISALEPLSPAPLDRVVKKCLAKDRDDRWHSAHDLHDEPQWVADIRSPGDSATPAIVNKRSPPPPPRCCRGSGPPDLTA